MKQYLDLLKEILKDNEVHPDRTGTGRISIFGPQLKFDLREGFPIVTSRKAPYKSAFKEMLWFIKGETNNQLLKDQNVHFWDNWELKEEHIVDFCKNTLEPEDDYAEKEKTVVPFFKQFINHIGPMYGYAWRYTRIKDVERDLSVQVGAVKFEDIASDKLKFFKSVYKEQAPKFDDGSDVPFETFAIGMAGMIVDQLQNVIVGLKKDPHSARHVMTTWLPEYIPVPGFSPQENILIGKGALAPCHVLTQFFATKNPDGGYFLDMTLYQRSADVAIGSCSNIAQYSLLLSMVAQVCNMTPRYFIYNMGDAHIYADQVEGVMEQLTRPTHQLPQLKLNPNVMDIYEFTMDDIEIVGYTHEEPIKYPIST